MISLGSLNDADRSRLIFGFDDVDACLNMEAGARIPLNEAVLRNIVLFFFFFFLLFHTRSLSHSLSLLPSFHDSGVSAV